MISPEMRPEVSEHPTPQKELITLPDRQVITVRAENQKRVIRLLLNAFKGEQPYVSKEELLGITEETALSLTTLTRAVRTLRYTLTGTGWDIQSITVNGKGVETRPKGYTLKKGDAQKADTPALLLQNVLDNKTVLTELVTNGQGKGSILEEAKQQIDSLEPQGKVIFLEKIFAILSDPDRGYQNKRDAALELLNTMDLKSIDPKELTETYAQAVHNLRENLNQDSDPYGEIHMLLEAGKTIAPFIENGGRITQAWKRVAKAFPEDDRQKILDDIEAIRRLIPTAYFEFDTKVITLAKEGLPSREIAARLRVPIEKIQRSKYRLKEQGIRFRSFNITKT